MDTNSDPDGRRTDESEQLVCRFTGWCKKTGYSLEYWEIFATDRRLIFCFVGESYSSLLLKADMGGTYRDRLSELELSEIATFDERNFTVPLSKLETIEYTPGSVSKKATLRFEWRDGEIVLYNVPQTSTSDDTVDTIRSLSKYDVYNNVVTTVSDERAGPFRKLRQVIRTFL